MSFEVLDLWTHKYRLLSTVLLYKNTRWSRYWFNNFSVFSKPLPLNRQFEALNHWWLNLHLATNYFWTFWHLWLPVTSWTHGLYQAVLANPWSKLLIPTKMWSLAEMSGPPKSPLRTLRCPVPLAQSKLGLNRSDGFVNQHSTLYFTVRLVYCKTSGKLPESSTAPFPMTMVSKLYFGSHAMGIGLITSLISTGSGSSINATSLKKLNILTKSSDLLVI